MSEAIRLDREQLVEVIKGMEARGEDASELRRQLEAMQPAVKPAGQVRAGGLKIEREELTTGERLNREVGDLFPNGITDEILNRLIDLDFKYSLKELKVMCIKAGFSPSGHKKKLAAKLVANGKL